MYMNIHCKVIMCVDIHKFMYIYIYIHYMVETGVELREEYGEVYWDDNEGGNGGQSTREGEVYMYMYTYTHTYIHTHTQYIYIRLGL